MFEHIMRTIGESVGSWLYLIAGGLCFAEAAILIGMVLPGETALLVAGVFCNAKYGTLNLGLMIAVAAVCAIAGDSVGYEFGKKYGPALRRSRLGRWVGEHRWAAVDGFILRHGGKAVLLGRLTALFRALMPSMAGVSGMRYRTFLLWNAAGGLIWAPGCVLLGYGFASALNVVGETLTWAPLAVLALVAVVYLGLHLRKRRHERAEAEAFSAANQASTVAVD
ncbi:MAG: DedA family protein [Jatrophihabitans sp.]|uniref:DedA family protein n=1 Tax=Jatrophihabitans sp. TaxID=1932789 RepID=UPI003F7D9AA2